VSLYNPAAQIRLHAVQAAFAAKGSAAAIAHSQALAALDGTVQAQASILAFGDTFGIIGLCFVGAIPLLLLFKKGVPKGMRPPVAD
jgi:DHA2 family multidrug resistance protein